MPIEVMFHYFSTLGNFKDRKKKKEQLVHKYTCNLTFSLLWEVLSRFSKFLCLYLLYFGTLRNNLDSKLWTLREAQKMHRKLWSSSLPGWGAISFAKSTAQGFVQQYTNPTLPLQGLSAGALDHRNHPCFNGEWIKQTWKNSPRKSLLQQLMPPLQCDQLDVAGSGSGDAFWPQLPVLKDKNTLLCLTYAHTRVHTHAHTLHL